MRCPQVAGWPTPQLHSPLMTQGSMLMGAIRTCRRQVQAQVSASYDDSAQANGVCSSTCCLTHTHMILHRCLYTIPGCRVMWENSPLGPGADAPPLQSLPLSRFLARDPSLTEGPGVPHAMWRQQCRAELDSVSSRQLMTFCTLAFQSLRLRHLTMAKLTLENLTSQKGRPCRRSPCKR